MKAVAKSFPSPSSDQEQKRKVAERKDDVKSSYKRPRRRNEIYILGEFEFQTSAK